MRTSVLLVALALVLCGGTVDAQEAGDPVVLVTKSGRTLRGTLVSKDDRNVRLRVSGIEVAVDPGMVASITAATPALPPIPPASAPDPAGAAGTTGPAAGSNPAPAAALAASGLRGSRFLLKEGTVLDGFVLARDGEGWWVVPGRPVRVGKAEVEKIYGSDQPLSTGSLDDETVEQEIRRAVRNLTSDVPTRSAGAEAVLKAADEESIPALVDGLTTGSVATKSAVLRFLGAFRDPRARLALGTALERDADPSIRSQIVGIFEDWNDEGTRAALLDSARRDKADRVRLAAIDSLADVATPAEAAALLDYAVNLAEDSPLLKSTFVALRKATGKKLGDDKELWTAWWYEGGGEEEIDEKVREERERTLAEEEARRGVIDVSEGRDEEAGEGDGGGGGDGGEGGEGEGGGE